MWSAVSLFARLAALFLAGHCAVLAVFAAVRAMGGHPAGRAPVELRGLRYAAEYVGAEAFMLTAAISLGAVRLAPFSAARTLVTLALGAVWWEAWFYAGHRLLHTRWLFRFHRPHHGGAGVHPSLRFSAVETVMLSGGFYVPLALASHAFDGVSAGALAATFGLAYVLNVLSHLDYDLFGDRFEASPFRHVLNSTRYHALHHAGRRGNYGLNSPWLDRLFGTEIPVREAIARGAAGADGREIT